MGKINQSLQVCNIVLMDRFHFSTHGCGNKVDFTKRKEKLLKKLCKSIDSEASVVFTNEEISFLIEQIHLEDERVKKEKIEFEKIMKRLEKDLNF